MYISIDFKVSDLHRHTLILNSNVAHHSALNWCVKPRVKSHEVSLTKYGRCACYMRRSWPWSLAMLMARNQYNTVRVCWNVLIGSKGTPFGAGQQAKRIRRCTENTHMHINPHKLLLIITRYGFPMHQKFKKVVAKPWHV